MAAAAVMCNPPTTFSARLATEHPSSTHSHTPSTFDTPRRTLYPTIPPRLDVHLKHNTLPISSLDTHGREDGRGGRSGVGMISAMPDVVTGQDVSRGGADVGKEGRTAGSVSRMADISEHSEYSDEDSSEQGSDEDQDAGEFLTTFSDPGHYAYTDRPLICALNAATTVSVDEDTRGIRDSNNLAPPPSLQLQHDRPSAPSPLSARVGRPPERVKPKVQFIQLTSEHERKEGADQSRTHDPPSPTSAVPPPVPPKSPQRTLSPEATHRVGNQTHVRLNDNVFSAHIRRHRYSSSDPGHESVLRSPNTTSPNPATRARTMPGYRTAHTPLPSRAYRDTRPNNLDAILESAPATNPYAHVYTGIRGPHDEDVGEVDESPRGVVFPRWGSRSTVAVGRASASTIALGGERRERRVSNKLRKAPPARRESGYRARSSERTRKVSSVSMRRSPIRSTPARSSSPVKRSRTLSFGYLSRMRLRLRKRSEAKAQARPPLREPTSAAGAVPGMEGYVVEPFNEILHEDRPRLRPASFLSTTTTQTFHTARGTFSPGPRPRPLSITSNSRPLSATSFESAYTYTNLDAVAGGGEESTTGRRMSVTFEDEEKALRFSEVAMDVLDVARAPFPSSSTTHKVVPAHLMTSTASGTPYASRVRPTPTRQHPPATTTTTTRPAPFPSTAPRTSTSSSSAVTSATTSTTSCTSGVGRRSSVCSTPPTSAGVSDASGHYFSLGEERERARSVDGHDLVPPSARRGKLMKKRPTAVSLDGVDTFGHDGVRSSVDLSADPALRPSRAKNILGIKIGTPKDKKTTRDGRLAGVTEGVEVDYLPQMRPSSPLWAESSGVIPNPYSRLSLPSICISDNHLEDMSPTDALASLAFTGNSSALSSSALAALTSRLTHRASNEVLEASTASSLKGAKKAKKGKPGDVPPWTAAFSVTPVDKGKGKKVSPERGAKGGLFDPYAEMPAGGSWGKSRAQRLSQEMLDGRNQDSRCTLTRDSHRAVPRARPRTRRAARRDNSPNTLRRWTLAMADVPDEILIQELEKLRMEGRGAMLKEDASPSSTRRSRPRRRPSMMVESSEIEHDDGWHIVYPDSESDSSDDDREASPAPSTSPQDSHSHHEHPPGHLVSLEDLEWKTARRALLCCRELVRTERSYQACLRQLLAGDTATPPPGLVLTYVPALLRASEALLSRLEDDPSAWGVSAAFVAVEEDVEAAFVAWAGVVGEIFVSGSAGGNTRPGRKLTRGSRNNSFSNAGDAPGLGKRSRSGASISQAQLDSIYRKRGVSLHEGEPLPTPPSSRPLSTANNTMGLFTAALGTGLAYGISPSTPQTDEFSPPRITTTPNGSAGALGRTFGAWKTCRGVFGSSPSLSPASPTSPNFSSGPGAGRDEDREKEKKLPSVRELAILPVQRVMRYVLQYRDLVENTPFESPSRGLVERALESAMRIAAKCDRAQDNSAFFLRRA